MIFGTVTPKVGVVGIFASSAVGAKEMTIRVLECPVAAAIAIARLGIFAVLTGPAEPQVPRIPAIASVRLLPVIIQRFEAGATVEAVSASALDSRSLALVTKPTVFAFLWEGAKVEQDARKKIENY